MESQFPKKKLKLSVTCITKVAIHKANSSEEENTKEAIFLITLLQFLSDNEFEYFNKIKALSALSMAQYDLNDLNGLFATANSIKTAIKSLDKNEKNALIKSYFRLGENLLKQKHLLVSFFYLHQGKTLMNSEPSILTEQQSQTLTTLFQEVKAKLTQVNQSYLEEYKTKKDEMILECEKIISICESASKPVLLSEGKEQKIYLVNAKWMQNANKFALMYKESIGCNQIDFLKPSFVIERQTSNYFRNDSLEPNGCFPLEINNYDLIDFDDCWKDTDEASDFENVLLMKNLKLNKDYVCLNEVDWTFLNKKFGSTNEILRLVSEVNDGDEAKYEIDLYRLDVLILEKGMREINKHLLKFKKIQFSTRITIKQFKEKILRCLRITKPELKVNVYNGKNITKEALQLLLIAFTSNCKFQAPIKEILLNDEDSVNQLTALVFPYLIIEVIESNDQPFLIASIDKCSNCNNVIEFEDAITCPKCRYNYYCSTKCMKEESSHQLIHDWPYWIPELMKIHELDLDLKNENSRKGRAGLVNLGNTCFMASGIQCLSNTIDLTKYFLSGTYSQELNMYSRFGSKGAISNAYFSLLNELWNGNQMSVNTNIFRRPFTQRTGHYNNNSQQDSQEMISLLLDHLHEDLNRINQKPYFEMKEKMPHETDAQASQRWWNCHKKRDDSIIVDLFHGQFKATIICPNCNLINISFDPFMFFSLSIPSEVNILRYKLFLKEWLICVEDSLSLYPDTNVFHLKREIALKNSAIKVECIEVVVLKKDRTIRDIPTDSTTLHSLVKSNEEIICYEKKTENSIMIYTYPIKYSLTNSYFFQQSITITYLTYPWAYEVDSSCTLKDIWIQTYKRIPGIIPPNQNDIYDITEIEKWKTPLIKPFTLLFSHQFPNNTYQHCKFCDGANPFCEVFPQKNFNSKYIELIDKSFRNSSLIFLASIPANSSLTQMHNNIEIPLSKATPSLATSKSNYHLQDCLNLFKSEEKLSADNAWYCTQCKKHQEAWKKLEIYQAPNYLIIHLKRFKIKSNNVVMAFFNNHKNTSLIEFPVRNFSLSDYIIGPNAKNAVYDLYAVVNHSGGLNMGHYYAFCKNQGSWILYNDEKWAVINETEVVTSNAYVLFYKKKVMEDF